jgi:uncharacterized linocin/CFP29 family protein
MSLELLNRDDAPFGPDFWEILDSTVKSVAEIQLSARKLIFTDGPAGLGLQFVPGNERRIEFSESGAELSLPHGIPLVQLCEVFSISGRNIEVSRNAGLKPNFEDLVSSLLKITTSEDKLLFYGAASSGISGLLTHPDVKRMKLTPWDQPGDSVESVLRAIEILDNEGFHGPYSLGLSVSLYNKLFRRYPNTDILELDHLKQVVTGGIIKSAAIVSGGVIITGGAEYASIVLGQDLMAGFEGPSARDYIFTLSETVALRLNIPRSVCVLEGSVSQK